MGSNAKAFHEEEPVYNPDAYPRLLLDVLRNDQSTFVRRDELEESWRILTPLLHELMDKKVQPIIYEQGSRGPTEADQYIERLGVKKDIDTYKWKKAPCPCEA